MGRKKAFTVQSFILCLLFNGLMLGCLYWAARQAFLGLHDGMALVTGGGIEGMPDPAGVVLGGVGEFVEKNRALVVPVVFGLGGLTTLALWLSLLLAGRRLIGEEPGASGEGDGPSDDPLKKEVKRLEKELQAAKKAASKPSPAPAIMLCEDRICSVSVVPERGTPAMKTGLKSRSPIPAASAVTAPRVMTVTMRVT